MFFHKIFSFLILLGYATASAHGATYFVDNSAEAHCNNSPSHGSEAKPWCTISYALSRMQGGDTLNIKTGIYNETLYIASHLSGTKNRETTIRAIPGASVTVRGTGFNSGRVKITGCQFLVLDGLNVTHMNQGIYVENSTNIIVRNCTVYEMGQEGIHVNGNSRFITIQSNRIHDMGKWSYNGEGIYIGTGSKGPVDNTSHVTVSSNVIYHTTDEAIELKPGTHDCVIEGNLIYNASPGKTWGAIEIGEHALGVQSWLQNPNHIVRNNIVHGTGTAIRAGTGCLIYNNIIYSVQGGGFGIYVDNNAGDNYLRSIYHNTIDVSQTNAVYVRSGMSDVKNNLGPGGTNNLPILDSYFISRADRDYRLVQGGEPVDSAPNISNSTGLNLDIHGNQRPGGMGSDYGAFEFVLPVPGVPLNFRVTIEE